MNQDGHNNPITEFRGEYSFLSNFWMAQFEYEGITWASAEAAYQAMKSDSIQVWFYMSGMSGRDAKRYGRTIKLRDGWDDMKIRIMTDIVFCKFTQNNYLKILLLETGHREIIEGNNWGDTFWGVCNGKGRNELGRILMYIRDIIRHKQSIKDL